MNYFLRKWLCAKPHEKAVTRGSHVVVIIKVLFKLRIIGHKRELFSRRLYEVSFLRRPLPGMHSWLRKCSHCGRPTGNYFSSHSLIFPDASKKKGKYEQFSRLLALSGNLFIIFFP